MAPRRTCECGSCKKCKHREYKREWYARPENTARHRETAHKSRHRRIEAVRQYDRARRRTRSTREQNRAHKAVERAIKSGELKKEPCEACGDENSEAHHDDYSRPLDVTWLCRTHHMKRHQRINPDEESR